MSAQAPKNVVVLGSTGSIGVSALKVARDIPGRMRVVGLAANRSVAELAAQARETGARAVCLSDPSGYRELAAAVPGDVEIMVGEEGLCELAQMAEADLVLVAIVGTAGLRPALAAIEAGKDLAVASKEILVMAGEAVMAAAARKQVAVLPVDSEHNAIFQCLDRHGMGGGRGAGSDTVRRLILTASGGPFRTTPAGALAKVTVAQALDHPTWEMGRKITIDSATLFNKGLEMIEARWLFGVPMEKVEVVVHPQSIIHSMVEFIDGSVLAQLSHSDMCFPIQYAVTWPDRVPNSLAPLDFAALARLDFEPPRTAAFPALDLARHAGTVGGTMPAVLNAANETAVAAFLAGELPFPGIWEHVSDVMQAHRPNPQQQPPTLDDLFEADAWARAQPARR